MIYPTAAKSAQNPTNPITATWKTFRNSTYGLEFKCPYSWQGDDDIVIVNTYAVLFTNSVNKETYILGIKKHKNESTLKQSGVYQSNNDIRWNIYEDASSRIWYITFKNGYEYFFSFPISQTDHKEIETVLKTVTISMQNK